MRMSCQQQNNRTLTSILLALLLAAGSPSVMAVQETIHDRMFYQPGCGCRGLGHAAFEFQGIS